MEEEYMKRLEEEMLDLVGTMNDTSPSVYTGEEGLISLLSSVKLMNDGYTFRMQNLDKESLFQLLSSIKEIGLDTGVKRLPISKELAEMKMECLSQYVTSRKTGLYDVHIRQLNFEMIRKIIGIVFTW